MDECKPLPDVADVVSVQQLITRLAQERSELRRRVGVRDEGPVGRGLHSTTYHLKMSNFSGICWVP